MRRFVAGWLVLVLLVASCSDKQSIPSGILSREDMQNVLWDMIQADQYSSYLLKDSAHTSLKLENLRLYEQVFQLHHLSREDFSKSYKYYMGRPELTQTLFDSLLALGNRKRTESYSRPVTRSVIAPSAPPVATPFKIADSLNKNKKLPHSRPPLKTPPIILPVPPSRLHPSSTPGTRPPKP